MRLPPQSPPVQRNLLMSESHRTGDGIHASQSIFGPGGPFGIFGPGGVFGPGRPAEPFWPFASIPGCAPHITYEINTWVQAVPLDSGSAGCCDFRTAHRIG
jgi:hypothetical protein